MNRSSLSLLISALVLVLLSGCKGSEELTSQYDTLPKLREHTPPAYPEKFLLAQEDAAVLVRMRINDAGNVVSASVVKSSGSTELDQAALNAVKTWKYYPATKDGKPVPIVVEQKVELSSKPFESVTFSEIVVGSRDLADSLWNLLDAGADFSQIAKKFSEVKSAISGGLRETVRYDVLQDAVRIVLDRIGPGQLSLPFERADGRYMIIKRKRR